MLQTVGQHRWAIYHIFPSIEHYYESEDWRLAKRTFWTKGLWMWNCHARISHVLCYGHV